MRAHSHSGVTPRDSERLDAPSQLSPDHVVEMMHDVVNNIGRLSRRIRDTTRFVDEKRIQTLAADTENVVSLLPQFERMGEHIESVIVTGPPTVACPVKLGERVWNLTIPATGILVIAPIGITLDYEDDRFLTSATAGQWGLELTGYADVRQRD
jgi:hypothetical protein